MIKVIDLPNTIDPEKYYEYQGATSNSDLSLIKGRDNDFDPTEAYRFGNLFDCMVTEPDKVNWYKRTVEGVQGGPFTEEQFDIATDMRKSVLANQHAAILIRNSNYQKIMIKRVVVEDEEMDGRLVSFTLDMRCKWDFWANAWNWGGDLKSTTAETQEQFEAACSHFDYDRQRFVYMTLGNSIQDILIGVSKVKPHNVFMKLIQRGDDFFESGKRKFLRLAYKAAQLQTVA